MELSTYLLVNLHSLVVFLYFFFYKDTATTVIYTYYPTLSLHDALPICSVPFRRGLRPLPARLQPVRQLRPRRACAARPKLTNGLEPGGDRKSTRLNSSH